MNNLTKFNLNTLDEMQITIEDVEEYFRMIREVLQTSPDQICNLIKNSKEILSEDKLDIQETIEELKADPALFERMCDKFSENLLTLDDVKLVDYIEEKANINDDELKTKVAGFINNNIYTGNDVESVHFKIVIIELRKIKAKRIIDQRLFEHYGDYKAVINPIMDKLNYETLMLHTKNITEIDENLQKIISANIISEEVFYNFMENVVDRYKWLVNLLPFIDVSI